MKNIYVFMLAYKNMHVFMYFLYAYRATAPPITKRGDTRKRVWFSSAWVTLRQAACGGSMVPPPTVPISMEGIVQEMCRSSPVGPLRSSNVMQLELAMF